jgi:4-diphosphocytidyl-2-C-methyl-D-erythritol kinase
MAGSSGAAAKINLALHVTGQRADGYHLLDSLVVFADVEDRITASPAPDLSIDVTGPFAFGVPVDGSNLILRAAKVLREIRNVRQGAALHLEKSLPHAAGIGSASSDAATALALLADLWNVQPLPPENPAVLTIGADVPVCMRAPNPSHLRGIGEVLSEVPTLPACALVLVNPRVQLPTRDVFRAMTLRQNPPMQPLPARPDFDAFARWVVAQRNDLQLAAQSVAPEVGQVLSRLRQMPLVKAARMSGSGPTCFGLVRNMADARQVARAIQVSDMGWWVVPALVLPSSISRKGSSDAPAQSGRGPG